MDIEKIILKKRSIMFINYPSVGSPRHRHLGMSIVAELMNLGFALDRTSYDYMSCASEDEIKRIHDELLPLIASVIGVDVNYQSLYKQFPQELIEKSYFDFFVYSVMDYWSSGEWYPDIRLPKKYRFEQHKKFKPLYFADVKQKTARAYETRKAMLLSDKTQTDQDMADFRTLSTGAPFSYGNY